MTSKPTVELTISGDSSKLSKAFGEVGDAANQMSTKVKSASDDMQSTGKRFDELAEKSDTVDTRAMGFRDTVTGVSDSLKGLKDSSLSTEERLLTLGMGIGDLASGFTNLIIPAIGNLATMLKGPLSTAMTFVSSHPLLITIGLLAAAFVLLWTNSETFRSVIIGVFKAVGEFVGTVVGWIGERFNGLVSWFGNLPSRIGAALSGLGSAIGEGFKGALNLVIGYLNWWISRVNDIIDGINFVNPFGKIPHISPVSKLHSGGVLPGAAGEEALFVGLAGEIVTPPGGTPHSSGSGASEVRVTGSGGLADLIQGWFNDGTLVLVGR